MCSQLRIVGSRGLFKPLIRGGRVAYVLAYQAACVLLMIMATTACRAEHRPAVVCPMLLMDIECTQYQHRITKSTNESERNIIKLEYKRITDERLQYCACSRVADSKELDAVIIPHSQR